jgi:TonB family protein
LKSTLKLFPERSNLPEEHRRQAWAGALSIVVHVAAALVLLFVPFDGAPPRRNPDLAELRRSTPLIAPPSEFTQKEPNKGPISKEVNAASVMPRPDVPAQPPPTPRPQFIPPAPAPKAAVPLPAMPDPPKLDAPQIRTAQLPQQGVPDAIAPPPQIQTAERPKLAFEKPGASSSGLPAGTGRLAAPKGTVDEAMRGLARGGGAGGIVVGDMDAASGSGGLRPTTPSPGRNGSNLELLSDPMGVDFRPYLIRILAAVRRNWLAVVPESAKLGRGGRVIVQFSISREGRVPKLVIATPSGTEAFDRAAVAGISASNPFPPLPPEFKGEQIRVQFAFSYNVK